MKAKNDVRATADDDKAAMTAATTDEKADVLCPVTVRFPRETWDRLREIADCIGVSQAQVVRDAVTYEMEHYAKYVHYVDKQQGKDIKAAIMSLTKAINEVQMELNRIGVNYNQEIRLKQIERKYAGKKLNDIGAIKSKIREEETVKAECNGFTREDLDAIMKRYEDATAKVGEVLCHILT